MDMTMLGVRVEAGPVGHDVYLFMRANDVIEKFGFPVETMVIISRQ